MNSPSLPSPADFCVIDSALTARAAGFENVYIILDVSRAANVPPVGFLTPPADLLNKAHAGGVKFCKLQDMYPAQHIDTK